MEPNEQIISFEISQLQKENGFSQCNKDSELTTAPYAEHYRDVTISLGANSQISSIGKGDILFSNTINKIVFVDDIKPMLDMFDISAIVLETRKKMNIYLPSNELISSLFTKPSYKNIIKTLAICTENQIKDNTKKIRELKTEIRKHKRNLTGLSKLRTEDDLKSFIEKNLV